MKGVATSIAAFLGRAVSGLVNAPLLVTSFVGFEQNFGGLVQDFPLGYAVRDFFANGGAQALIVRLSGGAGAPLDAAAWLGNEVDQTGLHALDKADLFNLLCLPPDTQGGDVPAEVWQAALACCTRRRAFLIVDPPAAWSGDPATAASVAGDGLAGLGPGGEDARNAALYFPRLLAADPQSGGQMGSFAACGAIAGVIARTDAAHGVWKAPAGLEAGIAGMVGLAVDLNDAQNIGLTALGVNCLRSFPGKGPVIWGARTLRGADQLADDYKYIPVRRTALFIEESVRRGTSWAAFEPNDEPLWAQLRLNVGAFMNDLFRQGAFQGATPRDAWFVKCDGETNSQNDIDLGIVNILIGFAPLKPAEFVVLQLRQLAALRE